MHENLYPEYKRHGLGPLTKRFGVALDHHHMANYDAEATGRLLFIFIKDVFDKHGLTNLEQLNTDLVSEDSYKKVSCQTCDAVCSESNWLEEYL